MKRCRKSSPRARNLYTSPGVFHCLTFVLLTLHIVWARNLYTRGVFRCLTFVLLTLHIVTPPERHPRACTRERSLRGGVTSHQPTGGERRQSSKSLRAQERPKRGGLRQGRYGGGDRSRSKPNHNQTYVRYYCMWHMWTTIDVGATCIQL